MTNQNQEQPTAPEIPESSDGVKTPEQKPKPKPKLPNWASILIIVIAAVIVVGLVSWGGYELFKPPPSKLPEAGESEEDEFKDWKTYQNEKYGYEIKYPPQNWQTQGGADLYEIRNGGAFVQIGMAERNVNISLEDWFRKQYDYYMSIPDGNPIYAEPYDLSKVVDYDFNGIPTKKTRPISFDYAGISLYSKKGTDVLYVTYSEDDSNDKDFAQKVPTLNQILSTFKFLD